MQKIIPPHSIAQTLLVRPDRPITEGIAERLHEEQPIASLAHSFHFAVDNNTMILEHGRSVIQARRELAYLGFEKDQIHFFVDLLHLTVVGTFLEIAEKTNSVSKYLEDNDAFSETDERCFLMTTPTTLRKMPITLQELEYRVYENLCTALEELHGYNSNCFLIDQTPDPDNDNIPPDYFGSPDHGLTG